MIARNEATERQVQAARPDASTWLAANAGSGKTRVLTDRVARLLLDGVEPQNILCLTYTKAAASEMQNRLFRRLGEWAMLGDAELAAALDQLGVGGAITAERMRQARTLFARAIETPGGLKIQTIHSFCAALLRRFPLEAGVSPQFSEVEDRAAHILQAEIVEDIAQGPQAGLVEAVAQYVSDNDFASLTATILSKRADFAQARDMADLLALFDLPAGFDERAMAAQVFLGGEREVLDRLITALRSGGSNDQKAADKLATLGEMTLAALPVLEGVFLTGASAKEPFTAKVGAFPTKAVRESHGELMDRVEPLMLRVEAARAARLGLAAARKSHALHAFAAAFLPEYERRKQIRGWLDFDDLILKARHLLGDPGVAAWVLYRLDGGIDHILVDEAQDTSPEQWDVIDKLAQEFTSGEGARPDVERTIFVVGDKKQSIYSFQGADPGAFDRMQADFAQRLRATGRDLQDLSLEFSFRSAESILRLVDIVFEGRDAAGFAGSRHRAFKNDLPGRIDLWPAVPKVEDPEDPPWDTPVDRPSPHHHTVILAERIAEEIGTLIREGATIPDEGREGMFRRPVRAGDFLILVQRRSELFAEIIRACKAAGLPIAGADRLKVGAELAVKDLAALLRFLATPEDDLSLATALKSPLFGWTEQALFDLAHRRGPREFLWMALRRRAADFGPTLAILQDLMGQADFLRPFDLIERILTRHRGRRHLLGRLGAEAEDGINALLSQALSYERSEVPSLTGFLGWMETDDLEIKRQMGSAGDMIRVMTVHGSKGLESPIVILPDTGKRRVASRGEVMLAGGTPVWRPRSAEMPEVLSEPQQDARAREENERQRLLYVALTRAEKWLIVAAAGELDKEGDSWYQIVEAGLEEAGGTAREFAGEFGLSIEDENWNALPFRHEAVTPRETVALPEVFRRPAAPPVVLPETLSPSDLGGAKALPGALGDEEEAAKARGTRIHLLLEHLPGLPPADRPAAARNLLGEVGEEDLASALAEAAGVLDRAEHAAIFAPEVLAEVPVTATLGNRRIHGVIDRLIITDTRILAVDFKSNATVPADPETCPDGLLRQMGAYALALEQIYPGRAIETAILWTRTGDLMPLPHELVRCALAQTPHLDLTGIGS
ncbi:double-strand break repair helicase AddA [Albibacillus kandeliae]|uniref:double-strand break repair helicase AddA n=1 Tax=Albibacillus kandeliae TaxID=2174228 RepID=UPI000D698330|nr:double-strand break repair helicase AddA [Albibacillus kandeliae]